MCDCEDYESPAFLRIQIVTGRKPHTCCECNQTIQPGQKYECAVGKWEEEIVTFRTCGDCLKLREEVKAAGCDCTIYMTLFERAMNHGIISQMREAYLAQQKREREEWKAHPVLPLMEVAA